MTSFFVTATGTEVGKTYTTCGLIKALRSRNIPVAALKPVISGFDPAQAHASDTGLILQALGKQVNEHSVAEISPWRYHAALSPDMAAAREDRPINLDALVAVCASAANTDRITFIEGAGGIMSPLSPRFTNLDLIDAIDAHVLLVAGTYLGTISHTLTACEALKARGREPWTIVLSESLESPVPPAETARAIARFTEVPIIVVTRNSAPPSELLSLLLR
jgi:dethiobiotin synthetase